MRRSGFVCVMVVGLVLAAASTARADSYKITAPEGEVWKWGEVEWGTGAIITYSFMDEGVFLKFHQGTAGEGNTWPGDIMPHGWKHEIRMAFKSWAAVANLQFIEVPDMGEPLGEFGGSGDIRIGAHDMINQGPPASGTPSAHAFGPPQATPGSAAGDVHFRANPPPVWVIAGGVDSLTVRDIRRVATHEIGHSIGLGHVDDPDQVMCAGLGGGACLVNVFQAPQAGDIEGAQFIYGQPVPEPAAATLLLLGAVVLGVRRRRRP